MQPIKQYSIVKISYSDELVTTVESAQLNDVVVTEEPLEIWLSSYPQAPAKLLFTTMRTPGDDLDLVRGWLYSSGLVQNSKNIISITHTGIGRLKSQSTNRVQINLVADVDVTAYQRVEVMNSACGICGQQSIESLLEKLPAILTTIKPAFRLPLKAIGLLTQQLRDKQLLFGQTGGNHGVALFNQHSKILDVREDVGRHNALDKLIGANIHQFETDNHELESVLGVVLSSRASFELIQKAAMVNIRYVIAIGAPSSLAIDLAKDCGICLVGFVKSSGEGLEFNIYSNQHMLI